MPEVTVKCPEGLFDDPNDLAQFKSELKKATAYTMDAINPETGESTQFASDPDKFIDLTIIEVPARLFEATAVCLVTVTTYGLLLSKSADGEAQYFWPDRMHNINDRLGSIATLVADLVPRQGLYEGMDTISVTFLGKGPGCWDFR